MKNIRNGIVFSNDISRILKGNNALDFDYSARGMSIPNDSFIETLRREFKRSVDSIFDNNAVILTEEEMLESMYVSINDVLNLVPIISLDKIYLNINNPNVNFLDCTRLEGSSELVSRINCNDYKSVPNQIKELTSKLISNGLEKIVIADDVVFSGSVLRGIIKEFSKYGIQVIGIRSCISTIGSYNYFNSIEDFTLKCGYLLEEDVIDQICERDFYFGIAQSGISIKDEDGKIYKAPYFLPFGNPNERASIPMDSVKDFSLGCIDRSVRLWEEIERLSNRTIYTQDLPEKINGVNDGENVVKLLKKKGRML